MNVKQILAVLIILMVVVGSFFLYFELVNKQQTQNQNPPQIQNTTVSIEDKKIAEEQKPLKIDATYPFVPDQDEFNQKVQTMLQGWIGDFKKNSLGNDEAVKKIDPENYAKYPRTYDFLASYNKGQVDENIISVVFNVYAFEGGAHGATNFYPLNWDVKNKKEITLADLFQNQPDYVQKISSYCIAELTKQVQEKLGSIEGAWIEQGANPDEKNFSIFKINSDNTLTFYFPQYQVAPYVAGDFEVIMPR